MAISKVTSGGIADGTLSVEDIADDAVTAAKLANSINTDIATGVTGNTTANAALPKAGGAMTGTITGFTSTGIDDNATSTKVTVSNTGVDVTGRATTDGITSSGSIIFDNGGSSVGIHSDSSDGSYIAYGANEYLRFLYDAGGGETMRMHDSGYVTMPQGVTLGNGNTYAAANTLEDYEEGTWTPVFASASGSFGSISYQARLGYYIKIGNQVTASAQFYTSAITVGTASGGLYLGGFPFANGTGHSFPVALKGDIRIFAGEVPWAGQMNGSSSLASLYFRNASNGSSELSQVPDLQTSGNGNIIGFTAIYNVA